MFSLFNNKDINVYYKNNNMFIFIGENYENKEDIISTISSYTTVPLYLIFVDSSTDYLLRLSQEVAQNCSTMYPGNNKYIILDNENLKDQYGRFGDVVLLEEMYDSTKYKKEFNISTNNRIQIQCGCINRCKFCVNEQHKSVSRSHINIINDINKLLNEDIMLSGVNITSYNDGEVSLSGLCQSIIYNCKNIKSLILAGLDLQQFDEVKDVINIIKDYDKAYPILHFPIHTCNPELLKRNNLDYSVEQIKEIMTLCKDNQLLYSWDIICGLPTETEEMFNDTIEMIKKYKPVIVYIYPFRYLNGSTYNKSEIIDQQIIKQRCYKLASIINNYKEDTLELLSNPKYNIIKNYINNFDLYSKIKDL